MGKNQNVSRRNFIAAAAGTTASAGSILTGLNDDTKSANEKPSIDFKNIKDIPEDVNILFIISDQHRGDFLGNRGIQPELKTPYLDMLSENGICFRRAYTACPLCIPARPAYLTSKYPSNLGMGDRKGKWHYFNALENQYTLPAHLNKYGYHTGHLGKSHLIGESEEQLFGFQERKIGFTYDNQDYRAATSEEIATEYLENGTGGYGGGKETYNSEYIPSRIDYHAHFDTIVVDHALEFMNRNKGNKWYLQVGLEKPHPTLYPPISFMKDVNPDNVVIPKNWNKVFGDDMPERKRWSQQNNMNQGFNEMYKNPETGEWARRIRPESRGWTEQDVRNTVAAYIACINYVDHEIGRLLNGLARMGLLDKTLVVYTSDHGEQCLDHGMIQKKCMFEGSINIPMILCGPGIKKTGIFTDGLVEHVDLFPTYCAYLGIEEPEGLVGENFTPTLKEALPAKDYAYSEYFWDFSDENRRDWERALVGKRWKYVNNGKFEPELYDYENDPGENNNLAFDPKYQEVLEKMREEMKKHKIQYNIS
ncbi:Arylsulfatase [Limihaloglobus sulfuriphilus]|uniref:Arylsulfatase n=1 Tax=Limihaloglobus sulfuriphilus TaxID=1851148 RepID=A0A1Q2MCS4_9BACT|nr:sulfatase-like hydrolase/transferase [Limihaloglobus sulfuriphilus]AQQ70506.1 Arylsulfatase [Limihaloglobus sulfuriphilus]